MSAEGRLAEIVAELEGAGVACLVMGGQQLVEFGVSHAFSILIERTRKPFGSAKAEIIGLPTAPARSA